MNEDLEAKQAEQRPRGPSSCVRFAAWEYARLVSDCASTGKSIPWLLKTAYFNRGIAPPTLDVETRKTVLREICYMGNNINQIARQVNMGLISNIKSEIIEILDHFRNLRSFLGRGYGDNGGRRDGQPAKM